MGQVSLTRWAVLGLGATLLTGCQRKDAAVMPDALTPTGQVLYELRCASCHQIDGAGISGTVPPLSGSTKVNGEKTALIATVLLGMKGPQKIEGSSFDGIMPSWKDTLTSTEIAEVLSYLRNSWGNAASEIDPEEVDHLRQQLDFTPLFPSPSEITDLAQSLKKDSANPSTPPK